MRRCLRLASLDTLLLADETKALAEATFLKKQMFYNMRIKTLRRNARQIIRLAAEGRLVRSSLGTQLPCIFRAGLHPGTGTSTTYLSPQCVAA